MNDQIEVAEHIDYFSSATRLAEAIRLGQVSSEEAVRHYIKRIKTENNKLHAIVQLFEETAIKQAQAADKAIAMGEIWGPLHGVPVTIKEAFDLVGSFTTANFRPKCFSASKYDAAIVKKLKASGAIIIAKTNLPTLLIDHQTWGFIYKRARHPYNYAYTPGGSSGGGAAAVAAGLSPLDIGSDSGGSLRIPSHFCGIYSLKPSIGKVALEGLRPPFSDQTDSFRLLVGVGPLACSIDDLILGYKVLSGEERNMKAFNKMPSSCNLLFTDTLGNFTADAESQTLLHSFFQRLQNKGFNTCKENPTLDYNIAYQSWGHLFGSLVASAIPKVIQPIIKMAFRYLPSSDPLFGKAIATGIDNNPGIIKNALHNRIQLIDELEVLFKTYHFLICPVTITNAFTHRPIGSVIEISNGEFIPYWQNGLPFTTIFNLTGHPVLVIPIGNTSNGMPLGVQIIGPIGADMALMNFGKFLKQVTEI